MITVKRTIGFILVTMMVLCMSACAGSKSGSSKESISTETGAWAISDQKTKAVLPEDVEKAFKKATEKFTGSTLEPIAYIGSQVVAGKNYMILCRAESATEKAETTYQMVIIYADLDGNAKILSMKDFDIVKFTEGKGKKSQEMLAGGWYAAEDASGSELPEEVKAVYDKATAAVCWEWGKVEPLAYLGSQIVSGTNYAMLCKGVLTEDDSANRIFVMTIHEDLDGNAEVSNTHVFDFTSFTE